MHGLAKGPDRVLRLWALVQARRVADVVGDLGVGSATARAHIEELAIGGDAPLVGWHNALWCLADGRTNAHVLARESKLSASEKRQRAPLTELFQILLAIYTRRQVHSVRDPASAIRRCCDELEQTLDPKGFLLRVAKMHQSPATAAPPKESIDEPLSENAIKVLAALSKFDGSASQEKLADRTRLCRHTVRDCLKTLAEMGLACRPAGKMVGNCLTSAGRKRLQVLGIVDS